MAVLLPAFEDVEYYVSKDSMTQVTGSVLVSPITDAAVFTVIVGCVMSADSHLPTTAVPQQLQQ